MEEMENVEGTDSRRSALKKLAVGGAAVWAAPAVLSSTASAAPGSPPPTTTTTTTVPQVCIGNGDWVCGNPLVICGTAGLNEICICEVDVEGNDICWGNFPCSDPRAVVCSSNADCLPGWKCASTCCGTTCTPPCDGTFGGNNAGQGELTAAGV
jgi:hypothetical protein